jgi:NAD(P)-dependent dehydrogenase (short-subunit alcohol dehydrogenase family)
VVLPADVTDAEAMEAAFARFIDAAGRLDVLFNNAGMFGPAGPIDEIPIEAFDEVLAVNIRGMVIAARLAFGQMRRQSPQGGRIINNGSLSAYVPRPGSVCYTTTKHAITGLTRTLSLDGRAFDIACGQIDIGNAETELVADLNARAKASGGEAQPVMNVAEAAASVLHMAKMPPEANVQFMTVMATKMPYIGRG